MSKRLARLIIVCLALMALATTAFAQSATESSAANPLTGTSWTLHAIDGQPVIDGSAATLQFADNTLSGNGGCNRFKGSYTVDGSALTVSPLMMTRIACLDNAATQQESDYVGLLQAAKTFEQGEDTLTITSADGKTLTFDAATGTPLVGTQWLLVAYGPAGQLTPVVGGSPVTLTLTGTGQALGNGGCNSYSGAYAAAGDQITLSNVASTAMACADDTLTRQESAYFQALGKVTGSMLDGTTLTLSTSDGQQLVFSAAALAGTQWQLTYYGQEYAPTPAISDTEVTLTFQDEAQLGGNSGCNLFGGKYQVDGSAIVISQVFSTMKACPVGNIMQQEQAFLAALQSASSYKIDGNTLTMVYAEGQLTFTRLPSPDAAPATTPEATSAVKSS